MLIVEGVGIFLKFLFLKKPSLVLLSQSIVFFAKIEDLAALCNFTTAIDFSLEKLKAFLMSTPLTRFLTTLVTSVLNNLSNLLERNLGFTLYKNCTFANILFFFKVSKDALELSKLLLVKAPLEYESFGFLKLTEYCWGLVAIFKELAKLPKYKFVGSNFTTFDLDSLFSFIKCDFLSIRDLAVFGLAKLDNLEKTIEVFGLKASLVFKAL